MVLDGDSKDLKFAEIVVYWMWKQILHESVKKKCYIGIKHLDLVSCFFS